MQFLSWTLVVLFGFLPFPVRTVPYLVSVSTLFSGSFLVSVYVDCYLCLFLTFLPPSLLSHPVIFKYDRAADVLNYCNVEGHLALEAADLRKK